MWPPGQCRISDATPITEGTTLRSVGSEETRKNCCFSIVVPTALNEDQTIAVIGRNTRSPLEMILEYSKELETRKNFIEYSLSACIQRTIMCNLSKDLVR